MAPLLEALVRAFTRTCSLEPFTLVASRSSCFAGLVFSALRRQLTGGEYDAFVAEFIEAAVDKYGKSVMLQVCMSTVCQRGAGCMQNAAAHTSVVLYQLRCLGRFRGTESAMPDIALCCGD